MKLKSEKKFKRYSGIGLIILCLLSVLVLYFYNPENSSVEICAVHRLTGLDCPGCGMTRAFHKIMHFEFAEALDYNILSPLIFILLGIFMIMSCIYLITGKKLIKNVPTWVFAVLLILLILFGILRNIPIYPFTYLHT